MCEGAEVLENVLVFVVGMEGFADLSSIGVLECKGARVLLEFVVSMEDFGFQSQVFSQHNEGSENKFPVSERNLQLVSFKLQDLAH